LTKNGFLYLQTSISYLLHVLVKRYVYITGYLKEYNYILHNYTFYYLKSNKIDLYLNKIYIFKKYINYYY